MSIYSIDLSTYYVDALHRSILAPGTPAQPSCELARSRGARINRLQDRSTAIRQHATGSMKDATGSMKDATGSMKDATGSMKDSTGSMKNATGSMKDATGSMKNATGSMKDATDKCSTHHPHPAAQPDRVHGLTSNGTDLVPKLLWERSESRA
jgi:uncharacterized protein YjbJ (UPF0337 family)